MTRARIGLLLALAMTLSACGSPGLPSARPGAPSGSGPASETPLPTAPPLAHEPTPILPPSGLSYPTSPLDGARAARLDVALRAAAASQRAVGLSAAVLVPNAGTWTGTAGVASVEQGRPMTPSSRLAVASITKTFVASLVLLLATDGALSLDESVRTILPDLPPTVATAVTVRELLDHTSGIADYIDDRQLLLAAADSPATPIPASRLLAAIPAPLFAPGRGWAYSNTNYLLLGLLVERVTGRRLAELLRTRLTGPLDLGSIRYQPEEAPGAPTVTGYSVAGRGTAGATGARDGLMPNRAFVDIAASAGGISATALDLARWGAALYGGRVLPAPALRAMVSFLPYYDYGLGAQRREIAGITAIGHHGRTVGFASALDELVPSGIVIVVLANSDAVDVGAVVEALAVVASGH